MNNDSLRQNDFRGYKQTITPKVDEILSYSGSKTLCGEYLRRYWHPVT